MGYSLAYKASDVRTITREAAPNLTSQSAVLPTYTNGQIADFIANGAGGAAYDIGISRIISVDITALSPDGHNLAVSALEAWSIATGISFNQIAGGAQITFDDVGAGASGGPTSISGGTINASSVNVGAGWLTANGTGIDSFSFQTYMHQIGHALGLGNAGNYADGAATYAGDGSGDNHYTNDSWQATVMSGFDQATAATGSFSYLLTPMIADILAMQALYGVDGGLRNKNTTYGVGSNVGGYLDSALTASSAFTIIDDGGIDIISFYTETLAMRVDLTPGAISDTGGLIGNMFIMDGTVIENFAAGSGNDSITGNAVNNSLNGNAGNDQIWGLGGHDVIFGGDGNDQLWGGAVNDRIEGGAGNDYIRGGVDNDNLLGGVGNDIIWGDKGNDRIWGDKKRSSDTTSQDELHGGSGADTIYGSNGSNQIWGDGGNDTIWGGKISDIISGGGGNDTLKGLDGDDMITGGSGDDIVNGGVGNDRIFGQSGADDLRGDKDNDIISGGRGNDKLDGGRGHDVLKGGAGVDDLTGGAGQDVFVFKLGWGNDRIFDFEDNIDTIRLSTNLWGGGYMSNADIIANFATIVTNYSGFGTHLELDFGGGDILKFFNVNIFASDLLDDISVF